MIGMSGTLGSHPYLKWMAVGMVVLGLVFGGAFSLSKTAWAGSNGQMLRVGNACSNPAMLTWVRITGTNQRNQRTVWEARPNSVSVQTNNYWWIGSARIEWTTNRNDGLHSTVTSVPKDYPRDWYGVLLDKWGC